MIQKEPPTETFVSKSSVWKSISSGGSHSTCSSNAISFGSDIYSSTVSAGCMVPFLKYRESRRVGVQDRDWTTRGDPDLQFNWKG
jgi:hypothetical protein